MALAVIKFVKFLTKYPLGSWYNICKILPGNNTVFLCWRDGPAVG